MFTKTVERWYPASEIFASYEVSDKGRMRVKGYEVTGENGSYQAAPQYAGDLTDPNYVTRLIRSIKRIITYRHLC